MAAMVSMSFRMAALAISRLVNRTRTSGFRGGVPCPERTPDKACSNQSGGMLGCSIENSARPLGNLFKSAHANGSKVARGASANPLIKNAICVYIGHFEVLSCKNSLNLAASFAKSRRNRTRHTPCVTMGMAHGTPLKNAFK